MIRFNPRIWVTAIVKTPLSSWLSFFRIFFFHHILPFPTSRVWLHVITRFFSSQTSILFFETFFSNVAEKRLSINRHECAAPCSRSMNLFFPFLFFFLSNLERIPNKNQRNWNITKFLNKWFLWSSFQISIRIDGRLMEYLVMSREVEVLRKMNQR